MSIVLNEGQKAAIESINEFLSSSDERFMSLEGPPGTGKTTVIKFVVDQLEHYYKTRALLGIVERQRKVIFTATTNKACEAFEYALKGYKGGMGIRTIHSHLNLIMQQDHNFKDVLYDSNPTDIKHNELIFIDEASYVDEDLWGFIEPKIGSSSRVIFMGDPAQLKQAEALSMPAFDSDFRKAELTQIMRQADDNPIQQLSITLRNAVLEGKGKLPPAIIDGKHIRWLPRDQFNEVMLKDMSAEDWTFHTSKFIAYRNKVVQSYNKKIYGLIQKSAVLVPGDYAINNNFVKGSKATGSIGTDRLVLVDRVEPAVELNTKGHHVYLDGNPDRKFFLPDDHATIDRKFNSRVRKLQALPESDMQTSYQLSKEIQQIKNFWIDLRPVYACTVYKSQGSTYRRVYVDLTDLGNCGNRDQMLRMLLVAISRASHQIFLTGDLS